MILGTVRLFALPSKPSVIFFSWRRSHNNIICIKIIVLARPGSCRLSALSLVSTKLQLAWPRNGGNWCHHRPLVELKLIPFLNPTSSSALQDDGIQSEAPSKYRPDHRSTKTTRNVSPMALANDLCARWICNRIEESYRILSGTPSLGSLSVEAC